MKYIRKVLIAVTFAAATISLGAAVVNTSSAEPDEKSFCQRCGDGFCAKSCENERTCPQDCAPQPSR